MRRTGIRNKKNSSEDTIHAGRRCGAAARFRLPLTSRVVIGRANAMRMVVVEQPHSGIGPVIGTRDAETRALSQPRGYHSIR